MLQTLQCICFTWASRNILWVLFQYFWNNDWDRTNNLEGWQASFWIGAERSLLTRAIPTNSPTKMGQSVPKAGNHLTISHSQGCPFLFLFIVLLIAYWMKNDWNATVIDHSSNYQFFGTAWLAECSCKRTHFVKKQTFMSSCSCLHAMQLAKQ